MLGARGTAPLPAAGVRFVVTRCVLTMSLESKRDKCCPADHATGLNCAAGRYHPFKVSVKYTLLIPLSEMGRSGCSRPWAHHRRSLGVSFLTCSSGRSLERRKACSMPHNAPPPTSPTTRPSWKLLYLVSGIGSILFVVLLLTALAIDIVSPPPMHGGVATLEFIAGKKTSYIIEQTLWILPNLLGVDSRCPHH